jgi:hypothetical protein
VTELGAREVAKEYVRRLRDRLGDRVVDVRPVTHDELHDDVDVVVLVRDATRLDNIDAIDLAAEVSHETGRTVSALVIAADRAGR